jgi:hypothetical protein
MQQTSRTCTWGRGRGPRETHLKTSARVVPCPGRRRVGRDPLCVFGAALDPLLRLANALAHVREQVALLRRKPSGVEGQRLKGARTAHGPHAARGTTPRAACLVCSPLRVGGRTDVPIDACLGGNACDLTCVACCRTQPCGRLQRPWRICQAKIWHWAAILRCLVRPPQPCNPAVPHDHLVRGHHWWFTRETTK